MTTLHIFMLAASLAIAGFARASPTVSNVAAATDVVAVAPESAALASPGDLLISEAERQSAAAVGTDHSLVDVKPDLQKVAERSLSAGQPTGLQAIAEKQLYATHRPSPPPAPGSQGQSWNFLKLLPGSALLNVAFAVIVIVVLILKGRG